MVRKGLVQSKGVESDDILDNLGVCGSAEYHISEVAESFLLIRWNIGLDSTVGLQ